MDTIASADGTLIAYERTGDGPPLVLVHGSGRDHAVWSSCLPQLAPQASVYAVDRRGRGASGDALEYTLVREVEDLLAVLAALDRPAHLFGHSYGAIIALEAAIRTDLLRSLILYEPPLSVGTDGVLPDLGDELVAILATGDREAVLMTFMRQAARYSDEMIATQRARPDWPARVAAAHTLPREAQALRRNPFAPEPLAGLRVPASRPCCSAAVRARPSSGSPSRRWRRQYRTSRCGCWPGSITTPWKPRLPCWPKPSSSSYTQNLRRPRPALGGQDGLTCGAENSYKEGVVSVEVNKALVRRYIAEWANEGNEAALHDVIAPDWVSHGTQSSTATPAGLPSGVVGAKQLHDEVRAIWPDNRWTIEDIFGAGDRVAVRMTNRATHRGTYRGIPATGKRVVLGAIWIFRLADGKIAEVWRCADDLGRVVQIGGRIMPSGDEDVSGEPPA